MPDDPSDRIMVVPPRKEKRKVQDKCRTSDERKSLFSRLVAWRYNAHAIDPLAAVRPPSFIINNAGITLLAKLHPQDISSYRQIRVILDQSMEWEEEWSKKIFNIVQQFEEDLITHRRTTATQKKNQQKRMKVVQNSISFEQESKENEERIRLQVLQRYSKQQPSSSHKN
jgi:ribonuclease D